MVPALTRDSLEAATYFAGVARRPNSETYGAWYTPNRVAVYDSEFKLVHRPSDLPSLFDLANDPLALHPLNTQDYLTRMDYMVGLAEDFLGYEMSSVRADLTKKDLQTLRSLGYIQ